MDISARQSNPYAVNWTSPLTPHTLNKGLSFWHRIAPHTCGGTTIRDLTRVYHGTLTNISPSIAWSKNPQQRPGGWGCLSFDGSTSNPYYIMDPSLIANWSAGTIAMWVCWVGSGQEQAAGTTHYGSVSWKFKIGYNNFCISLNGSNPATANVKFAPYAQNVVSVTSTSAMGDSVWRHIVVSHTSGSQVLYINGVQEDTGTTSGTFNSGVDVDWALGGNAYTASGKSHLNGFIDDIRVWNRILNVDEVREVYEQSIRFDPDLLYRIRRAKIFLSSLAPITGSASITQSSQTVTSAGTNATAGAASRTQAANTISSAATNALAGAASQTQAAQTASSAGTNATAGAGNPTGSGDSSSSAGTHPCTGDADITCESDAAASAAAVEIAGVSSNTNTDDSVSSSGIADVAGSASITQANETSTSDGTVAIVGDSSVTQEDNTCSGANDGSGFGVGSITQENQTCTSDGTVATVGVASITQTGETSTSAGTVASTVNGAPDQAADSVTSAGVNGVTGASAITQVSDTETGTGTIGITGASSNSQSGQSCSSSGSNVTQGNCSAAQASDSLSASGARRVPLSMFRSSVLTSIIIGSKG